MSVICQNFVQNTWRKDLCSNCFKSVTDHGSSSSVHSKERKTSASLSSATGSRYIPQATSIYQARGLISHIPWRSLLNDRSSSPVKNEGTTSNQNISHKTNSRFSVNESINATSPSSLKMNGHESSEDTYQGILKSTRSEGISSEQKGNVGFKEEGPQIIGYGGDVYDSEEDAWELGSDHGSVCLDSFDVTEEDRAISKITKENTEFNSVNLTRLSSFSDNEDLYNDRPYNENTRISLDESKNIINQTRSDNRYGSKLKINDILSRHENGYDSEIKMNGTRSRNENEYDSEITMNGTRSRNENGYDSEIKMNGTRLRNENGYDSEIKMNGTRSRDANGYDSEIKMNGTKSRKENGYDSEIKMNGTKSRNQNAYDSEIKVNGTRSKIETGYSNEMNGTRSRNTNGCRTVSYSTRDGIQDSSPYQATFKAESPCYKKEDTLNGNELNGMSRNKLLNGSILQYPFRNHTDLSNGVQLSNDFHNKSRVQNSSDCEIRPVAPLSCTDEPNSDYDCSFRKRTSGKMSVDSDSNPETNTESILSLSVCEFSETVRPRSSFLHGKTEDYHIASILPPTRQCEQENTSSSGDQYTSDSDTQNASASSLDSNDSASLKKKTYKVNSSKMISSDASLSFSRISNDVALPSSEDPRTTGYGRLERMTNKPKNHSKSHHKKGLRLQRQDALGSPDLPTPGTDELTSVHYAVTCPIGEYNPVNKLESSGQDRTASRVNANHKVSPYAEGSISSQDSFVTSQNGYDPMGKMSRETKLAALALELEQARRHSSGESVASKTSQVPKTPPEELPSRQAELAPSTTTENGSSKTHSRQLSLSTGIPSPNYTNSENNDAICSPIRPTSIFPNSQMSRFPATNDTRLDNKKKGKFSLRKLLKRNKEPGRYHTIGGFSSSPMAVNPKAWKQNEYDIAKLRLEIVHPMDIVNGNNSTSLPSLDGSTTEAESSLEAVCSQQTSPSADVSKPPHLYSLKKSLSVEEYAPKERDHNPEGHVQKLDEERTPKKTVASPPPVISDPSPPLSVTGNTTNGGSRNSHPTRPPKPPPPPRGPRSLVNQNNNKSMERPNAARRPSVPARPPPPKIPDSTKSGYTPMTKSNKPLNKESDQQMCDTLGIDYANLGDVRSHIAPKKPERSTSHHVQKGRKLEVHSHNPGLSSEENTYEMVELAEEEDHYTYLDEAEAQAAEENGLNTEEHTAHLHSSCDEIYSPFNGRCSQLLTSSNGHNGGLPPYTNDTCPDNDDRKPWFSLEESYAAIASANYEALVDLVTSAVQDRDNQLVKSEGVLHWNDFELEPEHPVKMFEDKVVYNATFKYGSRTAVTLLVTSQKVYASHNTRTAFQFPLLCLFSDYLPRHYVSPNGSQSSYCDVTKASIFVLQRSEISTIESFLVYSEKNHARSMFLRDVCFLLLQLIHILKMFQADGTEEIEYDLSRMLISRANRDQPPSLVLLPHDRNYLGAEDLFMTNSTINKTSLCQVALQMLFYLLRINTLENLNLDNGKEHVSEAIVQMFAAVGKVLTQEKAFSLSHAKNLLEYMLWGPVDIVDNADDSNAVNAIFQRWLDLQRAQNLKSLVSNLYRSTKRLAILNVYEEYQLLFLMQANVKSLKDLIAKL